MGEDPDASCRRVTGSRIRNWAARGMQQEIRLEPRRDWRLWPSRASVLLLLHLFLLVRSAASQGFRFSSPPAPVNGIPTLRAPPIAGYSVPPGLQLPPGFELGYPPPVLPAPPPAALVDHLKVRADTLTRKVAEQYSFCIIDSIRDRNNAFDFSHDVGFLEDCYSEYNDIDTRLCGESELQAYLAAIPNPAFPPFNSNCNHFSWPLACEPGWAASSSDPNNDLAPSPQAAPNTLPLRLFDPQPCCAGFFCPKGLTCMIPCPLGAYCPLASFWEPGGLCLPYGYQMSPAHGNQSCGGADMWSGVNFTPGIFCEGGHYCPATTEKLECEEGHYCRQGSTRQSACSRLTKCDAKQSSENLHGYGLLLIIVLALLLLLVYNCSDHVMHLRERRRAKARETAAYQARQYISAGERWKNLAKRQAKNFSGQLSRTFSRRSKPSKYSDSPDSDARSYKSASAAAKSRELSMLASATINEDESLGQSVTDFSSVEFQTDYEDLYPSIEAPPVNIPTDGYVEDRQAERAVNNSPNLNQSRSQIFKYAYGQIEREKFTMGDLLAQKEYAEMLQGSRRPPIELVFEDLCLILKGSGKKILSNVTGKLSPGRITAVMGPSGAGKTVFLNAIAGKANHSYTTGHVRINGQPGSIQGYRRIIGFVPQDDIVHGSLTVEENLWFSAKYRLPVDMPKREKVFVVERIINALGLGNIRDSRVGTVEKRGISGGQRKRVNVGLEMVMEPSLLILDEPTSGLDSTSSRLVLQALRREALVGVNVAVVVHQPSYGLFRMFDDVMFLAKGGRTVYLGPVVDVEEYFADLGVVVPERINPPDHFLDILAGVVKPDGDPNFDQTILPVMWMTHNGYRIPEDLQGLAPDATPSKRSKSQGSPGIVDKTTSFTYELYQELRVYVAVNLDNIKSAFTKVEDHSGRKTPGFFNQFDVILRRVALQRFREARLQAQDYVILLLAGASLGFLSDVKDTNLGSTGYTYTVIAVALLCMIAALRTFSNDKLQYWRESASGINRYAFFLAKDAVDLFNVVIKPLVYLALFYFFNDPRSTFLWNFVVTLALVYCVTGIGYIFAILLQPGPAQLWSVFVSILGTLLATKTTGYIRYIAYGSFARWALEAYVLVNAERYSGVWLITRCQVLFKGRYRLDHLPLCLSILFVYGAVARIVALFCLVLSNRQKQK